MLCASQNTPNGTSTAAQDNRTGNHHKQVTSEAYFFQLALEGVQGKAKEGIGSSTQGGRIVFLIRH